MALGSSGDRLHDRKMPQAALIEYTLSETARLTKKGIRVNCAAPGSIEFPGGT